MLLKGGVTATLGDEENNISLSVGLAGYWFKRLTVSHFSYSVSSKTINSYYHSIYDHDGYMLDNFLGGLSSLALHRKMNQRWSFIVDATVFYSRMDKLMGYRDQYEKMSNGLFASYDEPWYRTVTNINGILQCGFRRQKTKNKAFQFSLSAVGSFNLIGNQLNEKNYKAMALPVPTFSWLRSF